MVHAVAQSKNYVIVEVKPVLAEAFTNRYTPESESGIGPCDQIKDQGKMHTHCYPDEPIPKSRATIEELKLCVADIHGT